jgi:hypothetical protein
MMKSPYPALTKYFERTVNQEWQRIRLQIVLPKTFYYADSP